MNDLSKATCATCPFWSTKERHPDGEFPYVKRAPILTDNGTEWPRTRPMHFCGEHPIRRAAYELAVEEAKEGRRNG